MNGYGKAAIRAVELYKTKQVECPQDAWTKATGELFGLGTTGQKKGCPKCAFLGLCEEGLVKDVPRGSYTGSNINKQYALDAVAILRKSPAPDDIGPGDLWHEVNQEAQVSHNHQMDVVVCLWRNRLIV